MKKHTLIAIGVPLFLGLTSCGEKSTGETGREVSTQENTAGLSNKTGGEAAIKESLKITVNGVTADLMLKVPGFLLLEKPVHDIPEDYAGRDLVQVSVKWPVTAKQAAEIKRAEEEKTRLADLEARKQKEVERQQALDSFKKHLAVKSAFKGDLKDDGDLTTFLFVVTTIEDKAGETWFTIEVVERADQSGRAKYSAEYSGKLSGDGEKLELLPSSVSSGNNWRFMRNKSYRISLSLTGHEDKILFTVDSMDTRERYHYSGEFLRMEP